ncbi:hypothetical protein WJX73_000829 [Symbiochloris irregularis]|uniref:HIT-type domain-containing protein n=1 Tax=Symbiochloris irregularis TaxID=706552 RepID=A0AAW1PQZ9_9CHLO
MAWQTGQEVIDDARAGDAGPAEAASCQVCRKAPYKYKCPGCGVSTCSLPCSRSHKAASGCTGKKDPTEFCTLRDFTDARLLSDFFLLQKATTAKQTARKVASHQAGTWQAQGHRSPAVLRQLMEQARRRGVKLRMQPPGMTKSRCNTSCWDSNAAALMWRVHWRFPAANDTCIQDRQVCEDAVFRDVLKSHLKPQPVLSSGTVWT